jgi:hypothetical protein
MNPKKHMLESTNTEGGFHKVGGAVRGTGGDAGRGDRIAGSALNTRRHNSPKPGLSRQKLLSLNLKVDKKPINNSQAAARKVVIDVAIQKAAIPAHRPAYYLAATGAEVEAKVHNGVVQRHTGESAIHVTHEVHTEQSRDSRLELTKSASARIPDIGSSRAAGKGVIGKSNRRGQSISFESDERDVAAVRASDRSVQWSIYTPRADRLISDFVQGNYCFSVTIDAKGAQPRVEVSALLIDLRYFGIDRRPVGPLRTLMAMLWQLSHQNSKVWSSGRVQREINI